MPTPNSASQAGSRDCIGTTTVRLLFEPVGLSHGAITTRATSSMGGTLKLPER